MSDPTETSRGVVRLFGILQGLIFVVVAITIYLRWKKEKDQEEALKIKLDALSFKAGSKRQAAGVSDDRVRASQQGSGTQQPSATPTQPIQLGSALPTWPPRTRPEVVLGISANATEKEIEAAYKTLLKKYHPDRFESWGQGYKKRAHYVVLQVQKARDEMLKRFK